LKYGSNDDEAKPQLKDRLPDLDAVDGSSTGT
jgi:hypothetical protein